MFGLAVVPTVFFLIAILTVPESPRWLFAHAREKDAETVLLSYTGAEGAQQFLADIQEGLKTPVAQKWSALWSPAVRGSLFVAVGLTVLQQGTGINTIIYYGPRIFALAGSTSHSSAIFATLLVAVVNVIATVVGITLVDRLGRKPLLYVGVSGMTLALFSLSYAFHHDATLGSSMGAIAIACLMVYIAGFAFGLGAIAWILVAEVFPLRVRGRGVAAATLGSGISNFAVSFLHSCLSSMQSAADTHLPSMDSLHCDTGIRSICRTGNVRPGVGEHQPWRNIAEAKSNRTQREPYLECAFTPFDVALYPVPAELPPSAEHPDRDC
jgi:MFS family permease